MEKKNQIKKSIWMTIAIVIASFVVALNINSLVNAGNLFPGGFTGVSLLIQRVGETYFDVFIPFGTINIALNFFPALISYKYVGKKFTLYSVLMIVLTSVFVDVIPIIPLTNDILLISIFGGIISGLAVGLALRANASSGGTDFIAMFYAKKYNISTWNYVLAFNAIILLIAGALFGWDAALYSIIFQFCSTQIVKYLHLRYERMTLFIVTNKPDLLGQELMAFTRHGITRFEGIGEYSKQSRTMLYTVISSAELQNVLKFVRTVDPESFVNVTKSVQIDGNFYQSPIE